MALEFAHLQAAWDITRACNFHCIHCISGASKKWDAYLLSTDQAKRIIQRIGELGVVEVTWSGGEPLLRGDLEEIMNYGRRFGIERYTAVSNGYLLDETRLDKLIDAGLSGVQISIDGATPVKNQLVRKGPRDCFDRAAASIRRCVSRGLPVALGTMLYPEIVPDLDAMYSMAAELGVEMLRFCGFVPNGRGDDDLVRRRMTLSYDEMTTFLQFLRRRYFERPGFIGLDYAFALDPFVGSFHSREGRDHFFIDYRGDVFPSTGMERDAFKVGNALDEDLADVLRRPTLVPESPVRDDLRGICSTCDKFDDCLGGPRGIAFMFSGNFHSSPELCLYHEYRERQHILGSAIWPRMLSGVDLPQLRALRRTIDTQLATRGE